MTFWGTEFFKSVDDIEVRYGENINTYMSWDVVVEDGPEPGSSFVKAIIVAMLLVCGPLLLALQSNLLPIWIMLVSLQFIAHLSLMSNMMPANAV